MEIRVLFILKQRNNKYGEYGDGYSSCGNFSSGLYNSSNFVNLMLRGSGIESKLVEVVDGNSVDAEIHKFRPTHVILEALWCPPGKVRELVKLHQKVKFVIRNHSEIPFLSNEGMAMGWLLEYVQIPRVYIANNSLKTNNDFKNLSKVSNWDTRWSTDYKLSKSIYLPNFYPVKKNEIKEINRHKETVNVACFGAIRPLKNQLLQAVAAIEFAARIKKKLRFHINATRVEGNGDPILKNLRNLFSFYFDHELIEHPWYPHEEFLQLVAGMDVCMQVSLNETFNLTSADAVSMGIPIVVSREVPWVSFLSIAEPTDAARIVEKLHSAYHDFYTPKVNQHLLAKYSEKSRETWLEFLKS